MAVLSFVLRSALDSLSFCCMICQMFEILLFIYQVFLVRLNHDTGFAVVLLYMIRPMLRYLLLFHTNQDSCSCSALYIGVGAVLLYDDL